MFYILLPKIIHKNKEMKRISHDKVITIYLRNK